MKHLAILLFVILYVWSIDITNAEVSSKAIQGAGIVFNMKIKELRKKLLVGIPEKGIPPLDPLVLNSTRTQLNLNDIKIDATNTGTITGLLGFKIQDLIMFSISCPTGPSIGCITLKYKIVFPEINIDISEYNLDAYLKGLHLYGNGKLMLNIKNLILQGTDGVIRQDVTKLSLVKMDIKISLDALGFKITGWANDEARSKMLTDLIHNNLKLILDVFQPQISETLNNLIMKMTDGKFIEM